MLCENLEFCFKGSRKYVHGTDVYNSLLEYLKNDISISKKFDLSFHGVIKNNVEISNKNTNNKLKFACKYFDKNNNRHVLYGIEYKKQIECRYDFLEENIFNVSRLNVKLKNIILDVSTGYSFIENVVALNKHLLSNLFPDVTGQWLFTRIQIKSIPIRIVDSLEVHFKSNFNFQLIKSEVVVNSKPVGFIYFSLV